MQGSDGSDAPRDRAPRLSAETLLAGVAVRPFAQSAVRAGADAVSVDYFGDRDHRRSVRVLSLRRDAGADAYSVAELVELADAVEAEAVAYAADLENHPDLVGRLARGRRLLGNPPDVLRRARDPFRVAKVLSEEGLPVPEVRRPGELPGAGAGRAWLRKPRRGGGGRGVRPWPDEEPLTDGEYLQQRVPGTPVGLLFVADGQRASLLAATEMLVGRDVFGADGFLFCGALLRRGPAGRPLPPAGWPPASGLRFARRIVSPLVRELGLRGLNGVDVVLHEGQLWPLEVNPRWTSSMELLETGVRCGDPSLPAPLFSLHRRSCRGELPPPDALPGGTGRGTAGEAAGVWGKAVVRARRDAAAPDLEGLEGVSETAAARASGGRPRRRNPSGEVSVADVPEPGDPLPAGRPVCTLLAGGRDRDACLQRLEAGARRVHGALRGER